MPYRDDLVQNVERLKPQQQEAHERGHGNRFYRLCVAGHSNGCLVDAYFFWPALNIQVVRTVLSKGLPEKVVEPLLKKAELEKKYPSVKLRSAPDSRDSHSQEMLWNP